MTIDWQNCSFEYFQYLVSISDLTSVDCHGYSMLHYACSVIDTYRSLTMVELLFSAAQYRNIDLLQQPQGQSQPLHRAAKNGNHFVVMELFRNGIDINTTNTEGQTALVYLASNYEETDAPMVSFLIDLGIKTNIMDYEKMDALDYAYEGGHRHLVEYLLYRGAKVNMSHSYPRSQEEDLLEELDNLNIV